MKQEYELIVSIVNKGQSDKVVEASRAGGASGGTIIYGRGTRDKSFDALLGINIQPEREIVVTIVASSEKTKIMELICDYAKLFDNQNGICFSLPINDVLGSNTLLTSTKSRKTKQKN